MNKYATLAENHWRTWLPSRYAAIGDRNTFFSELGQEVSDRIASLQLDLLPPEVAGEDFLTRVGRRNMARLQAEEIVLREIVLLPAETDPDVEDEADELPPEWDVPTAIETVSAVAATEPLVGGARR